VKVHVGAGVFPPYGERNSSLNALSRRYESLCDTRPLSRLIDGADFLKLTLSARERRVEVERVSLLTFQIL
jgi:hypothetical protein